MEDCFQNDEFEENIKQEKEEYEDIGKKEEIGDNENNNENNKTNRIVKSLFNN